jgi:mannosyl-3-phosphoglycerate phosphatase
MSIEARCLIATDLDGTLLDRNYPLENAARAIDRITATAPGCLVVLASSKTFIEMEKLARQCHSPPMLVFENGAGIAWRPDQLATPGQSSSQGYEIEVKGSEYESLRDTLGTLRRQGQSGVPFRFRGFGDMDADQVAALTGLSAEAASDAKCRLASEPIVWEGNKDELAAFERALEKAGLRIELGGQFFHVLAKLGKVQAIKRLQRMVRYESGCSFETIACGDAPSDLGMLNYADHAIVFPPRRGESLTPSSADVRYASKAGPESWFTSVRRVLEPRLRTPLATESPS